MAGSKRGKHLVNKGKSKSKKSERVNDRQETSSSKPDMIQKHSSNPDERKDSKDKNPLTNMNFDTNAICGCKCNIGEDQLEKLLHEKFKRVYNDTFEKLLALGYKREIAKKAMLMYMGGSTFKDFLQKSAASLDSDDFNDYEILRKDRKGLKNTNELLRHTSESMMAALREKFPNMKRYGAMWNQAPGPSNTMTCPLHCKDQTMSSISFTESLGSRSYTKDDVAGSPNSSSSNRNIPSESNIDPLPKKVSPFRRGNLTPALVFHLKQNVPVIAAIIRRRIVALDIKKDAITKGSEKLTEESNFVLSSFLKFITDISNEEFFQEWLETCPDDSRNAVIVDLVRSIIDLKERVKEGKEWVRKTGVEVANELSLDLFELRMLRMEKLDEVQWENEKHLVEKFCLSKFSEMENTLKNAGVQFDFATEATKMLEIVKCSKIREYTEAYKLSASESEGVWQDIIEKERKCIENLVHLGKRIHQLRLHRDEVEQRMLELKLRVFEKAEAEVASADI